MRKFFKYLFFGGSIVLIFTLIFLIIFTQTNIKSLSTNFTTLQSNISDELNKSQYIYYELDKKGDNYLNNISQKSEFEKMRINFLEKLNNDIFYEDNYNFSEEQIKNFDDALTTWNEYKYDNRTNWYLKNINDVEEQFFNFSKDNPKIKAAWAFILLEELMSQKINISNQLNARAATLTLVYYYKSINKETEIEQLIDNETESWIKHQCPLCKE